MKEIFGTPYAHLRDALTSHVKTVSWPTPEAGFLHYIGCAVMPDVTLAPSENRINETPVLASNGYLYGKARTGLTPQFDAHWSEAFEKAMRRKPFPVDRESYFFRPLEVLGICIGASECPTVERNVADKLREVLEHGSTRLEEADLWSYSLTSFGAWQLGVVWKRTSLPVPKNLSLDELCLLHWLLTKADFSRETGLECPIESIEARALELCLTRTSTITSPARSGITLFVSEQLVESRISSILQSTWSAPANTESGEKIIANLARHFDRFVSQLGIRHDKRPTVVVTDEYDVQDLLHALLRIYFEDVRAEEWTPSYAGYSTRMDFLLKREQIVVEAKMTRKGLDQKGILKQLTEDTDRYRSHPDCKSLICFVYDPGKYCNNPTALEDDLQGQRDGMRVTVHVYPKP